MLVLQLSQPPHTLADTYIKEESHDISSSQATWGVSQNSGYPFGGPCNKDYSIWGSILG